MFINGISSFVKVFAVFYHLSTHSVDPNSQVLIYFFCLFRIMNAYCVIKFIVLLFYPNRLHSLRFQNFQVVAVVLGHFLKKRYDCIVKVGTVCPDHLLHLLRILG